ncbi:glycosyltransferase family 2 protein [Kineococcus sp. NBC_00420]|uniref:glycosyltransferase family 2 protein n=1 Tax=Kineococcus sp. NBC_00420 TaxID=2903564 RepID=UPI002E207CCC
MSPRATAEVDVVLPCWNEVAALPQVLGALPAGFRAVVVDNASNDGSGDVARALGALVVDEPVRGYGSAVHAGLLAATAEFVVVCDADCSIDLADAPGWVLPVAAGESDLVVGRRRPLGRGVWPWHARVANAALAARVRARTGLAVHDLAPVRAARRRDLLALGVRDRRSGYPLELLLRAGAAGWRVREVDVAYRPRAGRSKVTGTVSGTLTAALDMSRRLTEADR